VRLQKFPRNQFTSSITEKAEEKTGFKGAERQLNHLEGLSLKCFKKLLYDYWWMNKQKVFPYVSSVAVRTIYIVSLFWVCLFVTIV